MLMINTLQQEQSYVLWQIYVLRFFLNLATEALAWRLRGILFQSTIADSLNALPPKLYSIYLWIYQK